MQTKEIQKVLVANRGEIAIRIFRACHDLGIHTVAIYSNEDTYSLFRTKADEAYLVGEKKSPLGAYLDIPGIIGLAKRRGVTAIHPGYGFLSENADFARACEENGILFIGPSSKVLGQMGDKLSAKEIAISCGVPIIPGCTEPLRDAEDAVEVAIKQISDQPKSLHEIAPQVPAALVEITEKAMAKLPQNRYASAREMLDALDTYVQNPSVMFEYQYITEDAPEKVVKRTMNQNKEPRPVRQPQSGERSGSRSRKKGGKRKRRTIFLPALLGITVAFALACMALCWLILNDSSNLMNNKADITLNDYIGMTQEEAQATEQVASGQISVTWEQEYNSNYAAGYIYKQSPVSGRTVREGQGVTLTVSLGTQYVTVPDLTNYVQADAEQQLKSLGVSVLVTQAVDTSVASGAVIRTDPAAGTQVESGSTVVVYVSRPQVATTTKVPSLSGMSVDDARTLLVQNHLGLGSQTDQYSDQPVGTVIGQNPAAGSTAKLNGRVNITVSAGPEPAPVEPEAPSDSGSDWWGSLWGGDSSSSSGSSSSTETGESASSSEGSGLADWWASLLG